MYCIKSNIGYLHSIGKNTGLGVSLLFDAAIVTSEQRAKEWILMYERQLMSNSTNSLLPCVIPSSLASLVDTDRTWIECTAIIWLVLFYLCCDYIVYESKLHFPLIYFQAYGAYVCVCMHCAPFEFMLMHVV